ncbi:hypothetical protein CSR02_06065 [Acetobacter pomorum]|uniref:Uncharacterized protein n=1 Tax=Acetobacter pomorum TaxID=65959 RepID=A0A2G4RCC7_9PROT|nr:hypothetical protein [Acetobacter pomorum]PHY94224.1 hypothetical protein CSR02_06065 [Acetobacter pomorum]GBR49028.1 hypothetical protein AA11825_1209 [Acetobacter pomorum DSM 11825]
MQGDESITERQFDAAKVAAPYMHPKLAGLAADAQPRRSADAFTDEELAALAQENNVPSQHGVRAAAGQTPESEGR